MLGELHAIVGEAACIGNLTKIRNHKTMTGLKDTFLEVFLGHMYASYKEKTSRLEKQRALNDFRCKGVHSLMPGLGCCYLVTDW